MNPYQTIIIIRPNLLEPAKDHLVRKYARMMKQMGEDRTVMIDDWGVKPLAFPIRSYKQGHYALFTHYASEDDIKILHDSLAKDSNEIIKYISVKQDEIDCKFEGSEFIDTISEQPDHVDALDVLLGLARY